MEKALVTLIQVVMRWGEGVSREDDELIDANDRNIFKVDDDEDSEAERTPKVTAKCRPGEERFWNINGHE